MNYFITGATGFLGSYLIEELITRSSNKNDFQENSIKIIALKRTNSKIPIKLQSYPTSILEWVDGDLLDVVFLDKIMKGVDRVIHSAAIVSFAPKDKKEMQQTNVEGTENMVNAALANDVKVFCQISSVAALGQPLADQQNLNVIKENRELTFIDEKARWTPEYTGFSAYAFTKNLAELEVWRGQAEGLDVVVVNPSFVLGYDENNRSSTVLIDYIKSEKPYYGSGFSNFVDVRDVAQMTILLLENSEFYNERYILNGGTVAYSELMPKIAISLNKKPPSKPVPNWIKKYGWRVAKAWSFVSGKSPIITKDSLEAASRTVTYSNQKVKDKLNIEFRSLEETVAWIGEKYGD
jgi:nucleoside-diphosphate-sugar epimerase